MATSRTYRGSPVEARRAERRDAFLRAAREVYGSRGYHAATVKMICAVAGLTERYFYESFQNSEALFIAMHKQTSEHIVHLVAVAAESCTGSPADKVRAMLNVYYTDIQRDPASARLFALDAGSISPAAKEVCSSWRLSFGMLLAQALGTGIGHSSPVLRSGVVRALLGMGVDWMEQGFTTPLGEIVQAGENISRVLERNS